MSTIFNRWQHERGDNYLDARRVVVRPDANRVVLTVDNAGPAIPARRREHLFEPYFGEGEGHGLGLWVTYQLVQQMNGSIDVESVPEHTRFSVSLPLSDETHAS